MFKILYYPLLNITLLLNNLDPYYDLEEMENTSIKRDLLRIKKEMEQEENEEEEIVKKEYKNIYKI